jgi:hypothetical protein
VPATIVACFPVARSTLRISPVQEYAMSPSPASPKGGGTFGREPAKARPPMMRSAISPTAMRARTGTRGTAAAREVMTDIGSHLLG